MANDQSTTAVPAPAEPQVSATEPVAAVPTEHTVTTPDVLPDLTGLLGGAGLDEKPKTAGDLPEKGDETTGVVVSRP